MLCTRSPWCRWSGLSGLATLSPKLCRSAGDSWIADTFVPAHGGPYRILSCVKILYAVDFRELGIGIVPYSPLGHGFFGGRGVKEQVSAESNLVSSIDTVYLRISFLSFVAKKHFLVCIKIFFLVHLQILLWLVSMGSQGLLQKIWRRTSKFICEWKNWPISTSAALLS